MLAFNFVKNLADAVGASEPAVRLIVSLFIGYPIAFLHRKYFYGKNANLQHAYFIVTGLLIGYFNFGLGVAHSVCSVSLTYLILKILGGGPVSLAIVFIYTMAHLLIGYWVTATKDYDIKWTMPQCVLTLRLIGLAYNLSDGTIVEEKLSAENELTALREMPSILEVFGHSFFPSGFLVGPQFPLRKYKDFVELTLEPKALARLSPELRKFSPKRNPQDPPHSVDAGLKRGGLGLLYLIIHQLGTLYISEAYIISEDFVAQSLWKKYLLIGLWGRIALYKYISCWLITEGACIVTGLTYNGVDSEGKEKWDGCSNVKIRIFENATKMDHYIDSFNINTNHWVAQYIYKRLRFLNNKVYSQFGVLFFLAVWHGFHSGYYVCFFYEFISILAEKRVTVVLERNQWFWEKIYSSPLNIVTSVVFRLYTFVSMGYAMIPFILLSFDKYFHVYVQFLFVPHIIYICLIFFSPHIGKYILKPAIRPSNVKDSSQNRSKIE